MITVRVFPTLRSFLRPDLSGSAEFPLDLTALDMETVRVKDIIVHLNIPVEKVNMAIINGKIINDLNQTINDGDIVALAPAIGGG
jgi:molybdopterin converting factor small subunit